MKKMWCSFRPRFSSGLWHVVLINKNWKMYETAIPMGKMLNAFLAIHGKCKFVIFLRGQTPSLSAAALILSLMEHFQGKAKKHCKTQYKINIFHIQAYKLQLASGEPPAFALYIYIYMILWCWFHVQQKSKRHETTCHYHYTTRSQSSTSFYDFVWIAPNTMKCICCKQLYKSNKIAQWNTFTQKTQSLQ